MAMTKADIVEIIHQKVGFGRKESTEIVEQVFEIIQETLENGEKVKISGFGNFVVRQKRPRRGRNPKSGDEIVISARKVVTFKPSPVLRKALNQDRETLEAESNDL
jgi:integration host factor subunit alpha